MTRGREGRKREEDEKELIMDRLMEEEQLQEEADNRVAVLKVGFYSLHPPSFLC